jgi:hypothetical protein
MNKNTNSSRPTHSNDILIDYLLIAGGLGAGLIGLMFLLFF